MHILQAENVTKEIKGRLVLDRLAFSAEGGRVYGIAGKAGSGKTTLLQVLSGVVRLSEGRVLLDGTDYYSAENSLQIKSQAEINEL